MAASPCSLKRCRNTEGDISPPPLRRKLLLGPLLSQSPSSPALKTAEHESETKEPDEIRNRFEIISWNVNGISHLLPERQTSMRNYFSKKEERGKGTDGEDKEQETGEIGDGETGDGEERNEGQGEAELRIWLRRHRWPQVVCLQEVKIRRGDEGMLRRVERAANGGGKADGKGYRVRFELPRDRFNARGWGGRVYGVCTLVREDVASWMTGFRGAEWDLEGRVVVVEFEFARHAEQAEGEAGKEKEKLVVVNGYWPNGTINPWRDSQSGVVRGTRHDMKRRFHELMLEEVLKYQREGWQVVLIGDMNIAPDERDGYPGIRLGPEHVRNRKNFNEKFIEGNGGMRGIDSWRWVHGERRGYSYHGEKKEEWGVSCDRVDLGVVSRGLVEEGSKTNMSLVGAEVWESAEERGGSDHVPISVVLDLREI